MSGGRTVRDALIASEAAHQPRHERRIEAYGTGWELVGCICGWNGTDLRAHRAAALLPMVEAECRRQAAEELRDLGSRVLAFTPLSEREAGTVSDYTAGMHAAGRIAELRADAIEGRP